MRKNAGIKSKKEAAKRLIDGEVFWCDGHEIKFDERGSPSPFMCGRSHLFGLWDSFLGWETEIDWRENIGKGVLCWVWGDEYENKFRAVVIRYMPDKIHKYMIETPSNFAAWKNAEPMTEAEVMEYVLK